VRASARNALGDSPTAARNLVVVLEPSLLVLPIEATLPTLGEPVGNERAHGDTPSRRMLHRPFGRGNASHDFIVCRLGQHFLAYLVAGGRVAPLAADVAEPDPELLTAGVDSAARFDSTASATALSSRRDSLDEDAPFGGGISKVKLLKKFIPSTPSIPWPRSATFTCTSGTANL